MVKRKAPAQRRRKPDVYDRHAAWLRKHPAEIYYAWVSADPLFSYCSRGRDRSLVCGCLTQVAHGFLEAATASLTKAIRADTNIPCRSDITPEDFPIFAAWQRRIDRELKRKPPTWEPPKE